MKNINIFIADNQSFTRAGIITLLSEYYDSHVDIEKIDNKETLFERLPVIQPNLFIIDFDLFNFDTITDLSEIKKVSPSTGTLVITNNQLPGNIMEVLDCGITTYITKASAEDEFIDAVNATMNSRKYLSSDILDILLSQKTTRKKVQPAQGNLTFSELEIVKLIALGYTTKKIAYQKNLSYHTVITHRKNIFRKLGITNSSELIIHAMRSGIIDSTEYYI
jgi:DNA-binding NarL/FixJ family response regulator